MCADMPQNSKGDKKEIKKGSYSNPILLSNGMGDGIASFLIYANSEQKTVLAQDL